MLAEEINLETSNLKQRREGRVHSYIKKKVKKA